MCFQKRACKPYPCVIGHKKLCPRLPARISCARNEGCCKNLQKIKRTMIRFEESNIRNKDCHEKRTKRITDVPCNRCPSTLTNDHDAFMISLIITVCSSSSIITVFIFKKKVVSCSPAVYHRRAHNRGLRLQSCQQPVH